MWVLLERLAATDRSVTASSTAPPLDPDASVVATGGVLPIGDEVTDE
jgi:hypothetical protein